MSTAVSAVAFNLKKISDVCEVTTIVALPAMMSTSISPTTVGSRRCRSWSARSASGRPPHLGGLQPGDFSVPRRRQAVHHQWIINAPGSISDYEYERIGAKSIGDIGWNSSCQYAVQRLEDRWTAEVKIPLAEISFNPDRPLRGNFNRSRYIKTDAPYTKLYTWSYFIKGFHAIDAYGILSMEPLQDNNLLQNGTFSAPQKGRTFGSWFAHQDDVATDNPRISLDQSLFIKDGQSIKFNNQAPERRLLITQYLDDQLKENTTYHISFMVRRKMSSPPKRRRCIH